VAWTVPWNLIGLTVSGDVGDFTIYTDRYGKKVAYPRQPPEVPRTPAQATQRDAFAAAQSSWAALTPAEKASLEDACRVLSLPLTGQNLWISTVLRRDRPAYETVAQQSGITLPDPGV
jgi:hypothetical protein